MFAFAFAGNQNAAYACSLLSVPYCRGFLVCLANEIRERLMGSSIEIEASRLEYSSRLDECPVDVSALVEAKHIAALHRTEEVLLVSSTSSCLARVPAFAVALHILRKT